MSDREALLGAIRAAPADDTPRLVYADWLDEFGSGDLDRVTVEFIRMSCARPGAKVMPRKVYPWLLSKGEDGLVVDNWKRFVPSLLKIDRDNSPFGEEAIGRREGRMIRCSVRVLVESERGPFAKSYITWLELHRGFVSSFSVTSAVAARGMFAAVVKDQPLAELHLIGLSEAMHPRLTREVTDLVAGLKGAEYADQFRRRHF